MKKTKLFLFALISLCFCITGVKAEGVTAKIGDNEYNTLDAAIEGLKMVMSLNLLMMEQLLKLLISH